MTPYLYFGKSEIKIQDGRQRPYWKCNLKTNGHRNPCNTTFQLNVAWKVHFWHHFCILMSLNQNSRWPPSARSSFYCCFIHFWAMWHSNVCYTTFPAKFTWESHFKQYLFILYGDFINISTMTTKKIVKIKLSKLIIVSKVEPPELVSTKEWQWQWLILWFLFVHLHSHINISLFIYMPIVWICL